MTRPSVSVVISAYNASWCIERALTAALGQTVPPAEVFVCDDGSTDGTPDLVESRFGPRVTVLRLPHRNSPTARRAGLQRASGEWLAFLDADDWWEPNKLERQLDFLALHPEVRWTCTDGIYESAAGVERSSWLSDYFDPVLERVGDLYELLLWRCFTLMSSMLVERGAYHEVGGIDPDVTYSHDLDLWLRLAARHPGAIQAERLVHYWTHAGAMSRNYEARHHDNLAILARVARGDLRSTGPGREIARKRIGEESFDLGLYALRSGRGREGRAHMRRSIGSGPWQRRLLALAGSLTPGLLIRELARSPALKRFMLRARAVPPRLDDADLL